MAHKLFLLLQICWTVTPIWGAFQDFVIESEKDLKRFDQPSNDELYIEDDIDGYFYSQYENIFDEYYDVADDACGTYNNYLDMMTGSNSMFDSHIDVGQYEGTIDANILKEILSKLTSDPRFSHLLHLQAMNEDFSQMDYESDFKEELDDIQSSSNFVNYYEEDSGHLIDYEDNL